MALPPQNVLALRIEDVWAAFFDFRAEHTSSDFGGRFGTLDSLCRTESVFVGSAGNNLDAIGASRVHRGDFLCVCLPEAATKQQGWCDLQQNDSTLEN